MTETPFSFQKEKGFTQIVLGGKTMKTKRLVLLLASTALLTSCGGTVRKSDDGGSSEGKTVLLVATYDGGLGTDWLLSLGNRFAEKYKNVSFEEGKTGVVVRVLPSRSYNGTTLLSGSLEQDVYFTEDVSYFDHVNKGNFLDISSIVSEKLSAFGESKSIEDKLTPDMKEYLQAKDDKYYAIPFYDGLYGLIYDYDLFEDKNLFFDASGDFVSSKTAKKSSGPNGKEGDYDDGLPSTYAQFYKLISRIETLGMNPFSFSGGSGLPYAYRALTSYWSDYEGLENMKVNYSLNGTVPLVKSIEDGVASTEDTAIDESNGYLLQKQEGKLKALQFLKNITSHIKRNGDTQTVAQTNFIKNYNDGSNEYAMLFDGAWWENESTNIFKNAEAAYGKGKADRRYGFMSIPKADDSKIGEKQTLVSQNKSFCFVSAKTKLPELAKLFLQYAHTDENLSAFTTELSLTRALSYELTDSDKEKATFYGRNLIELKNDSNILDPVSANEKVIRNPKTFDVNFAWQTTVNGKTYDNPYTVFSDSATSGMTAEAYFEGLSTYNDKTRWDALN